MSHICVPFWPCVRALMKKTISYCNASGSKSCWASNHSVRTLCVRSNSKLCREEIKFPLIQAVQPSELLKVLHNFWKSNCGTEDTLMLSWGSESERKEVYTFLSWKKDPLSHGMEKRGGSKIAAASSLEWLPVSLNPRRNVFQIPFFPFSSLCQYFFFSRVVWATRLDF